MVINCMLNRIDIVIHSIVGLIQMMQHNKNKITQYSTKPYNSFGGNLKVGLDLFNDV